ncbi:hypothetical protein [Paracoccus sp. (in: a-proteobacteria)]|uniref:hypothetical protein n=1 Tax=Paracoccus sp. TaxID=267 RepID=UPI0026DFAF5A|nr:hypothetical protein [Paracoccus sp. (in: a-proteobacteria)]MDO5370180.1 hypothetical protein [Paracoccus sp. (in: a-proteobacteria)]
MTQFGNVGRVLRREGLPGLLARIRHPKRSDSATPRIVLPLRLGDELQHLDAPLRAAMTLLGQAGEAGICNDPRGPGLLLQTGDHAPLPETGVILPEAAAVARFLNRHAQGRIRGSAGASVHLVADGAGVTALTNAGVSRGRVFVAPALSRLAAGAAAGGARVDDIAAELARWLIAAQALDPLRVDPRIFPALRNLAAGDRLCLSLPETPQRRQLLAAQKAKGLRVFDGLRFHPAWRGCGLSYVAIARAALAQDAAPLLVCEDDAVFPPDFEARLDGIRHYLEGVEWDVFSGLLSDLPDDCTIRRVERRDGMTFVHLDRTVGTVLNIYGPRALERLAQWDDRDRNVHDNTIDRWLGRMEGLRVVTTLPFLVGHDASAQSTLFGFSNRRYDATIGASEQRLRRMVARFEARRP